MICNLPEIIFNEHAKNFYSCSSMTNKCWFLQIRDLCICYLLPHPLTLLTSPLSKEQFKKLTKSSVIDFWERKLRKEASVLTSLQYFNPSFMSLSSPHPIWSTAGSSPAKVTMATIQSQMLSGRYRTMQLESHWSTKHSSGFCILSKSCSTSIEDLPHILSSCEALLSVRKKLQRFTLNFCESFPQVKSLVLKFCQPTHPQFCQFLLDCSVLPQVILAKQTYGDEILHHLFSISRTWIYSIHRTRMKMLGRWNLF